MPGLTAAATVWREGLRRFHAAEYRPDVFEATQAGAVRVATRGDTLALSHDVLSRTQWAGRVRAVGMRAARTVATTLRGPERSACLRKLLEAKDCAVRASLAG